MTLPKLLLKGRFSEDSFLRGSSVVITQLEGGLPRIRKDLVEVSDIFGVLFVCNSTDAQYFSAFYETTLVAGSLPFLVDLYGKNNILEEYKVHIMGGYHARNLGGTIRGIEVQLQGIPT